MTQTMCGGLLTVMEELKVDKVIICKQGKDSENYKSFKKIVKKKNIKVIVVKKRRWDIYWKGFKNTNPMAKRKANTGKYFK